VLAEQMLYTEIEVEEAIAEAEMEAEIEEQIKQEEEEIALAEFEAEKEQLYMEMDIADAEGEELDLEMKILYAEMEAEEAAIEEEEREAEEAAQKAEEDYAEHKQELYMEMDVTEAASAEMEAEIARLEAEMKEGTDDNDPLPKSPLEMLADTVFQAIDPVGTAEWLSGSQLQPLMMRCNPVVEQATLGQIWSACASTHKGKLNKPQVVKMLGFLGQVQAGMSPNPKTYRDAPVPTIVGLSMKHQLDELGYLDTNPEEEGGSAEFE